MRAMSTPRLSELRTRVLIRRRSDHSIDSALLASEYTQERHRWAKLLPVGTAVYSESKQLERKITHRIWLRHIDGVTTDFEIVARGRVYRVERSAPVHGEHVFTVIEAEELGGEY